MVKTFTIKTGARTEFVNITAEVEEAIASSTVTEGICYIYVPHTTAAVTINEAADPTVVEDMITALDKLIPWKDNYRHAEGNSAAHMKTSLVGTSQVVLVAGGRALLGTWQGIYFCEFDGPRQRRFYVKVVG